MNYIDIKSRFHGIKETSRNSCMVLCPCHDDRKPSLSLKYDDHTGKTLLHCFAGCAVEDILLAVGLDRSDLYSNQKKSTVVGNKTTVYDYHSAEGKLLYRKTRVDNPDGKTFFFVQPNGTHGLTGVTRVLYNLPNVVNASTVYFVEGEKCADAIIASGRTATTMDSGAKSRWCNAYTDSLKDKRVVIVPDNDEPGRQYAKNILEHLPNAELVFLPHLPEKGDIYDWLNTGHTMEEVDKLPRIAASEFVAPKRIAEQGTYSTIEPKKETQAETMLRLVDKLEAIWFHDQLNVPYVALSASGHTEIWSIESARFATWLTGLYYRHTGKPPRKECIEQTVNTLCARALFENEEAIPLYTRVAEDKQGSFWYSLGNKVWQAVRITAEGWKIVDNPPIMFYRYIHQKSQIMPSRNGDIRRLLKYLNISTGKTLFLCWMVTCFVPTIPHVMPILVGEKGSAKSTACALLKQIIDPSELETISPAQDLRSLAITLQQHWFLPFDNISHISQEISDTLCRAITGGGIQQRKLYTDAESHIFHFQRCIALNGVNNAVTRSDLIDRSILIELERIPDWKRQELRDIQKEFEKDLPCIIGGIFDVLSEAMRRYPEIQLLEHPRMADFAHWGAAICEALGEPKEVFLAEYAENRLHQNEQLLEYTPIANVLIAFMQNRSEWKGAVSKLYEELVSLAPKLGIDIAGKAFPGGANKLVPRLSEIRSNLSAAGISYETRTSNRGSVITVRNQNISPLSSQITVSREALQDEDGECDDEIVEF